MFVKATRYENSDRKKQVCQRPAFLTKFFEGVANSAPSLQRSEPRSFGSVSDSQFSPHEYDFEAQAGMPLGPAPPSDFSAILKQMGIECSEEMIHELEGIGALLVALQNTTDITGAVAILHLYTRKYHNRAMSAILIEYVYSLFQESQTGVPRTTEDVELASLRHLNETQDRTNTSGLDPSEILDGIGSRINEIGDEKSDKEWVKMMRNLRDNWSVVRNNPLFEHLSKMLGILVTMELCDAANLTFSLGKFKAFAPDLTMKHASAGDVIDAVMRTITYMVEVGTLCWETNSMRPVFYDPSCYVTLEVDLPEILTGWTLVESGNLMEIRGIDEAEYMRRVRALQEKCKDLIAKAKSEKQFSTLTVLGRYFAQLMEIECKYTEMLLSRTTRDAPYVVIFHGGSAQGKSVCAAQYSTVIRAAAGLSTAGQARYVYNSNDQYMSGMHSDVEEIMFDDLANTKSSFVKSPDTEMFLHVVNDTPMTAVMADLHMKGRVMVKPKLVTVTTNKVDLDAFTYSNCPSAIQRRGNVYAEVKVKPQFAKFDEEGKPQGVDSAKVDAYYAENPDVPRTIDPIWLFTLTRVRKPDDIKMLGPHEYIRDANGDQMIDVEVTDFLNYVINDYHSHKDSQENKRAREEARAREICLCGVDGCRQIRGYCLRHFETQSGFLSTIKEHTVKSITSVDKALAAASTAVLLTTANKVAKDFNWLALVPTPWIEHPYFVYCAQLLMQESTDRWYRRFTIILWTLILAFISFNVYDGGPFCILSSCISLLMGFSLQLHMRALILKCLEHEIHRRNDVSAVVKNLRDSHIETMCKAGAIIAALYAAASFYRSWKAFSAQGSLMPTTREEVLQRASEVNPWTHTIPRPIQVHPSAATTTPAHLIKMVEGNLFHVKSNETGVFNGLFVTTNFLVIPKHAFLDANGEQLDKLVDVELRRASPNSQSGTFKTTLYKHSTYFVENTDVAITYVTVAGSMKDITRYLPVADYTTVEFTLLHRHSDGVLVVDRGEGYLGKANTDKIKDLRAVIYTGFTRNTFKGLCGSPIVCLTKPMICGIHAGGITNTPQGISAALVRDDILKAIEELTKQPSISKTVGDGVFETQVCGVPFMTSTPLHPKSPILYTPPDAQYAYLGSCVGKMTFKSNVKVTPISEFVIEEMDSPNIYRGPKVWPPWEGWQKNLDELAHPSKTFDPEHLNMAIEDYVQPLLDDISSGIFDDIRPLTELETWNGIPGNRYISRMNLDTAIGYPRTGPKKGYFLEVEPFGDYTKVVVPDDITQEEVERLLSNYRRGERGYPIAKANKKDEILSKEKMRIMYGSSAAFCAIVRLFFLPIIAFLQSNPLRSEMAVGINSHGPEWNSLVNHILEYSDGKDRIVGCDYSAYDNRLSSQMLFCAFNILRMIAVHAGYSDDALKIMDGIATDIVYSVIAYDGDLIQLTGGGHISGNPLTVVLNSLCGSLNWRLFVIHQRIGCGVVPDFRSVVHLVTYGDDNIGSVKEGNDDINLVDLFDFINSTGQKVTMPDKTSEVVPYMKEDQIEFLKRDPVFHPEPINMYLGALHEKSIFKMLHCFIREKGAVHSEEKASALNIDTACREWFNHGRDVYERRRSELKRVAERAEILYMCHELDLTYDDRVKIWCDTYLQSD